LSHRPRKRFGQNFLHDPGVIARIVTAIGPRPGQHLIEIGPGQGAITCPLLETAGKLDVIELDRDLLEPLAARCGRLGDLRILNQDVLQVDFRQFESAEKLRIVGNLPYNISTPLLFHLLDYSDMIQDMHFLLQKEVVERMAAVPDSHDYGRLSVTIQLHCHVDPLFDIGPDAFRPAPKVDSTFVRLIPHDRPPVEVADQARFGALVKQAFAQRRKTLRNNLRGLLDEADIVAAGLDPGQRPQTVTLEQFAILAGRLEKKRLN
jgi:16S rRNA (adenine1518-N6/adenine1519-N6)-dimethyltransferase